MLTSLIFLATAQKDGPMVVDGALCHPERLMVELAGTQGETSIRDAGYKVIGRAPEIGYVTVKIPPGAVVEARNRLRGRPGIARVDLDHAKQLAYTPNDPLWTNQWHMRTIKADLAWDWGIGAPVIIVAVIDTGLNVNHPDLAANVWVNIHEIPGNNVDDDGNGYIDDINGYDFANLDATLEDLGHGTPCAGLVGAIQDNGIGGSGVAPRAKIMGLKATNDSGLLFDSYLIPAYFYAASMGAKVLSMSYFSDRVSNAERLALDYCERSGILPVAAAGNDDTLYPYYPAGYESVLAVAATGMTTDKASFSDYGSWVDVAAPGVSLTTTATNGYTNGFGGTSGACPHVAGLAALLFASNPSATNKTVRAAIEDSATLVTQSPYGEYSNYGIVDARGAMEAILTTPAPPKPCVARYITPTNAEVPGQIAGTMRIYGRGFQPPRNVVAKLDNTTVQIVRRSRDWVDLAMPNRTGNLVVTVDGLLVATSRITSTTTVVYPACEAGTKGAALYNGTYSKLAWADGAVATCERRNDGRIYVQSTFRRVVNAPAAANNGSSLVIRRRYAGTTTGTENIYLYDWSSGSFPYGNFVLVRTGGAQAAGTSHTIPLANLSRFIDFEGTVYALIDTTGVAAGGILQLDQLNMVKPR